IAVYTSELDHSAEGVAPEILLQDRLKKGKERLDHAIEALALLCEPVQPPRGELEHIHYFCGNTEAPQELAEHEPQRSKLYKATVGLIRAFANISDDLDRAGYSRSEVARVKRQVDKYLKLRDIIKHASGETLDLKPYEADMRHLIDTYIQADEPRKISPFDDMGLLDLIVKTGIADAIASRLGQMSGNKNAVAETIENNVRSKIIREHLNNPAYYYKMSAQLQQLIELRKAKAIEYEEYLKQIAALVKQVDAGHTDDTPEALKRSRALRALYDNLKANIPVNEVAEPIAEAVYAQDPVLELALKLDEMIKKVRPDDWRGYQPRENTIKAALLPLLNNDPNEVERIFVIIKAQSEY
ncbi:MAG: DUF3387 domain-containing protein, partial [Mariprofundales bacterium]